jgi:pyrimidine deaminase RibD-like protein/NTP pyrophosphatase (non-canonical NTP hydrolase)
MRLAIEQAANCTGEDGRSHPRVGAVLVSGSDVFLGHRGATGPGNHAEYGLLEKHFSAAPPKDATLYTTLEPCVTRNHPKFACADRIVENRGIKTVYIGMLDPNPAITGKGLMRLRDAGIAVRLFEPDLMEKVEHANREFSRSFRPISYRLNEKRLPADLLGRSLDNWYEVVNTIYLTKNFDRNTSGVFAHLAEILGGLGSLANGKEPPLDATDYVAKAVAWWMALAGKIGVERISEMIWSKYPRVCPYCREEKHDNDKCVDAKRASRSPNWQKLAEIGLKTSRPVTLGEWQAMFNTIYPMSRGEDYSVTIASLMEELGELSEALRVRELAPGYFLSEASDVFAWLMHLQNLIDRESKTPADQYGRKLELAFATAYPDRCARCQNQICICPPLPSDTFGRIAHEMPHGSLQMLKPAEMLARFGLDGRSR